MKQESSICVNSISTNVGFQDDADNKPEAGKFRTILPQILAVIAKNLLILDLGLSVAFPTIVIPALRRTITSDVIETLYFTDNQASWFGSIAFICQPIGSILSGWISEPLGRKRAMIIVNIPHIIAWTLLYFSNSLKEIYIGAILLGLGIGFMEAPVLTYVGEICQPSIRGTLLSCAGIAGTLGMFIVYLLGSIMNWRKAALICLSVPLTTMIAISFIPETPMWLLSKNRIEDARKSLQWLRGWVSPKAIEFEFYEMYRYSENANKCHDCQQNKTECDHTGAGLKEKFKELTKKGTLKAFFLVTGLFTIGQFSGISAMRPFMVQIFQAYNVPIDSSLATVYLGIVGFIANIASMSTMKILGKRRICLIGLIGSVISCIALGSYGETVFPCIYNSFDKYENVKFEASYFPLIAFFFLSFWTNYSVLAVPWWLLSEVFPFKARSLASGIVAATNYGLGFLATKTYLNFDKGLSLNGVMWFFTSVNIIGIIFVYFLIPETENRSLEDIEMHFSDNNRKLTDINIAKISSEINKNNNIENDAQVATLKNS